MPPTSIKPDCLCRTTLMIGCICMMSIGCASTPDSPALDDAGYRTIQTGPLRDTDSAVKANAEGLSHLDSGELYQAEQAFRRALAADIGFGPAHNNLGKILYLKRDFYRAAHEFDDAIRLMPKAAAPRNNLGLTLAEAGKLDEAIDQFREAATLDPTEIQYQANLVRTLVQRGDRSDEVITLLRSVAANDPRVPWRVWASHQLGRSESSRP